MASQRELIIFLLFINLFADVQVFSQTNYDLFWLVQQWPPAVCSGRRCAQGSLQIFTIHGFWPQKKVGQSPVQCSAPQYSKTLITGTLRSNMNNYWPDVISGNNDKFWAHEWNKHGTCSYGTFKQVPYFERTVAIRRKYDLLAILAAANIKPTGSTWNLDVVKRAIKAKTGRQPGIRCDANTRTKLIEIVLCYDKKGTTLIDCSKDRCSANLVW